MKESDYTLSQTQHLRLSEQLFTLQQDNSSINHTLSDSHSPQTNLTTDAKLRLTHLLINEGEEHSLSLVVNFGVRVESTNKSQKFLWFPLKYYYQQLASFMMLIVFGHCLILYFLCFILD